MTTLKILALSIGTVILGSCADFLDPYPTGDISSEEMWQYPERIQGLIGQAYDYIPVNYNDNEGAFLDCATDDAVSTSSTRNVRRLALNILPSSQDPFATYWNSCYQGINLCNTFLKDNRGFNLRYIVIPRLDSLVRYRLQGEAYGLRAWFQWSLLQKFGGKGTNGIFLGFPIVTEPLDFQNQVNLARNTYDDCVQQIINDCDSAFKYLPIAHRDYLMSNPSTDAAYAGSRYWGRIDGITTRAIKAMVYLTWASPRFNPSNDISRWDSAAVNARKVMTFKQTVDNVTNGFNPATGVNWVNPNFPGIIWGSRWATSDEMERMFYPGGFQGNGAMGATQELVNAFPMANGYPIDDPANRGAYDPANPYKDRDPRFYATIFYNNSQAKKGNTGAVMYTFNNWSNEGKDAAGAKPTNSMTNYHIKKFVYMGLDLNASVKDIQRHSKFLIRWAHMCLIFAESANQVVGPLDNSRYGLSAKDAIIFLRTRKTYDNTNGLSATDPYLDEVAGAGPLAFDALIKNERRIETCFEGIRFYDLRRWTTDLTELNKPVHGATVVQNLDLSFTYDLNHEVESRVFKSAYLPIPYNEILKMSNLVQNEGWEGWE